MKYGVAEINATNTMMATGNGECPCHHLGVDETKKTGCDSVVLRKEAKSPIEITL